MYSPNFIFSNDKRDRIKRHLLFWFCYWLYFTFLHAASTGGKPEISYFKNIPFATLEAFCLLVPQVLFTYALISFVLPKYLLRNKYVASFVWIFILVFASGFMNYFMLIYIRPLLVETILPERFIVQNPRSTYASFYLALIVSLKGTLVAGTAACSIRLFKFWHLKEKRNLELIKEKTEAQLQLLTAQVHPHFLFNTLNNIYSKVQNESPGGAKMVMELSNLLRYILSEGNKSSVPLSMELTMMKEYINLEKVRYGNKLDLHISIPNETGNLEIAPLLLLPFIENCFKHGASKFLIHPWINLKIELSGSTLVMKLMNGKEENPPETIVKSGIGINNVKKRLELLYQHQYELRITDEADVFIVNLKLALKEEKYLLSSQDQLPLTVEYA